MRTPRINHLVDLLSSGIMSRDNTERCIRICYDAAKIIHLRQERLHKSQLKIREITSALTLVHFHHTSAYRFNAVGCLAENFRECDESKALRYYGDRVMGTVADQFGRLVLIDEDGMKSLYKEPRSGRHVVASENYEESRGKRLPWIRHVIENSRSVYILEEKVSGRFRRSHIYTAIASIPLKPKPSVSYFIAVVAEDGNRKLKFLTAYAINSFNRFLKCIEPGSPMGEG
jgi:hypothetical protein